MKVIGLERKELDEMGRCTHAHKLKGRIVPNPVRGSTQKWRCLHCEVEGFSHFDTPAPSVDLPDPPEHEPDDAA